MIKSRPAGSNITLINTINTKMYQSGGGKPTELLSIVYKDVDTGQKYVEEIVDPIFEYYIAKENNRTEYNRLFTGIDEVTKSQSVHLDLEKDIAKQLGLTQWYYNNIQSGNRSENKKIHTHPDLFGSDTNIEDQYRAKFARMYRNDICHITKAFFDIEVDAINMMGDFPQMGECPINAITIIFQDNKQVFTFVLRDKTNPQIPEFESRVKDGSIFPELKQFVINAVGGDKAAKKFGIDQLDFNFLFYDEEQEINLIQDLFNAINNFKPDFALAWNMGFDVPYIIERIKVLGYDPKQVIAHPDFKHKFANYIVDERNKNEYTERGDFGIISSYTVFLDQMIQFASRRKGQTRPLSFSLDHIGEKVAKVKKLDYKHITTNIAELPKKNFLIFVFYNIMDTIVQYCIEKITGDLEYVFSKCNVNNTRYSKCHRQTIYLTNRGAKEFYLDGFIMGNNPNRFNPKPDKKFPGAFVADMTKLNDYSRMRIHGRPINIFDNTIDEDYRALYPSIIRQLNIAPNTQIGMVVISNPVHSMENLCMESEYSRAGQFMEDIQSQYWLEFCTRWMHLPDFTELYSFVYQFMLKVRGRNDFSGDIQGSLIDPVMFNKRNENEIICPVNFTNISEAIIIPVLDIMKAKEWRENAIKYPNQSYKT